MAWSTESPPPTAAPAAAMAAAMAAGSGVATLTRLMVAGDEDAWSRFHAAYFERLRRYLLVVTRGDEEATGEALQAALLRVVRHLRRFDDEAAFWNWLTVLARTAAVDHRRKRHRYLAFLDRFLAWHRPSDGVAPAVDPDERLSGALGRALRTLPVEERGLIEAKYEARRSVHELALAAGETDKAVESRLGRVRRKLKAAILEDLKHER
jgi:RNA polymerase sigma-70 factor (ECF subfamily)